MIYPNHLTFNPVGIEELTRLEVKGEIVIELVRLRKQPPWFSLFALRGHRGFGIPKYTSIYHIYHIYIYHIYIYHIYIYISYIYIIYIYIYHIYIIYIYHIYIYIIYIYIYIIYISYI